MKNNNYWNCSTSIVGGQKFYVDGLNIWEYKWKDTGEQFTANVPSRQSVYIVRIYEIEKDSKYVKFGAVEASNNAFIIYTNYYQSVS